MITATLREILSMVKRMTSLSFLIMMLGVLSCSKPKDLQYLNFQNFRLEEISGGQSVISAELQYYNPNNFKLKLKEGQVDVTVNNTLLGNSRLDTLMEIPKKDTFLIPLHMKVDTRTLMSKVMNLLFTSDLDIKLDGHARLGKGGIYFNVPIHYQGKQKINLFK
jgi:LEA14-like dessication related protein